MPPAASIFTHVIICFVKICETNLLGLRLIRADARPVDLDFRDESLFECAAKPISLIIIYRYTKGRQNRQFFETPKNAPKPVHITATAAIVAVPVQGKVAREA